MRRDVIKKGVAAGITLCLVLLILMIFTPSYSAVKLFPGTPNPSSVKITSTILFSNVNLTIRDIEAIPVDYLEFKIYRNENNVLVAFMIFTLAGTESFDSADAFTVTNVTNISNLPFNSTWGYGYDERTGNEPTFNYGYGYGPSGSFDLSILYNITYRTNTPGTFYAKLFVNSTNYTYVSEKSTIFIVQEQNPGGGGSEPPPSSNEAPIADANGPYVGYVNKPITFDGSKSTDDNGIIGYRWDWTDDGTYETTWSTSPLISYTYTIQGGYTLRLEVKDDENLTDSAITSVNVITTTNHFYAPYAEAAGPYNGLTYQNIQFDASGSYGVNASIENYTWMFGDGTLGYGIEPTHAYYIAGTFKVNLTVTDSNDFQALDTTTVTIVLDENRNGIPDIMDQTIGADITLSDIYALTLNGVLYYLVDTNADDIYDIIYNPTKNTKTILGQQDGKQLIDIDDDGRWEYIYDPVLDSITTYVEEKTSFSIDSFWLIVAFISIIIVIAIFLVYWFYSNGYI